MGIDNFDFFTGCLLALFIIVKVIYCQWKGSVKTQWGPISKGGIKKKILHWISIPSTVLSPFLRFSLSLFLSFGHYSTLPHFLNLWSVTCNVTCISKHHMPPLWMCMSLCYRMSGMSRHKDSLNIEWWSLVEVGEWRICVPPDRQSVHSFSSIQP